MARRRTRPDPRLWVGAAEEGSEEEEERGMEGDSVVEDPSASSSVVVGASSDVGCWTEGVAAVRPLLRGLRATGAAAAEGEDSTRDEEEARFDSPVESVDAVFSRGAREEGTGLSSSITRSDSGLVRGTSEEGERAEWEGKEVRENC